MDQRYYKNTRAIYLPTTKLLCIVVATSIVVVPTGFSSEIILFLLFPYSCTCHCWCLLIYFIGSIESNYLHNAKATTTTAQQWIRRRWPKWKESTKNAKTNKTYLPSVDRNLTWFWSLFTITNDEATPWISLKQLSKTISTVFVD